MGQNNATIKQTQILTPQILDQSIKIIFDHPDIKFESYKQIIKPISRILQHLEQFIPANQTSEGFIINLKMIKIMYHKKFLYAMSKLITLLMQTLQLLMTKNTLTITRQQWKFCSDLTSFIIFFSDDKIIRLVQSVSIRTDIHYQSKQLIQELQKQGRSMEATQFLIDKFSTQEVERIEKCLRISLNTMINLRLQVLTRSKQVLNIIRKLQQSCFILYLKAIYSSRHSHPILIRAKKQFLKANLTIGHYFLGCGSDNCKSSIYQAAIIFLYSLLEDNKTRLKDLKALPSHLFKNLPIISQNTVYDFIINICLFSLCYVKQGANIYSRMSFNRIMTLKLVDLIVKQLQITSPQITYYLQQLSIQTRAGQIQRAFVSDLVDRYRKIISETVNLRESKKGKKNTKQQQQNLAVSRYSRQVGQSKILQKFTQASKINYNIKYSNKSIKVTPIDVVTQLENDENTLQTQFRVLCQKYIYQVMLNKKIFYQYNDRQIWSEIIQSIMENKSDQDIYQQHQNSSDGSPDFKMKMVQEEQRQIQLQQISTQNNHKEKNQKQVYIEKDMKQSKVHIECEPQDLNDQNIKQEQNQQAHQEQQHPNEKEKNYKIQENQVIQNLQKIQNEDQNIIEDHQNLQKEGTEQQDKKQQYESNHQTATEDKLVVQ